MSATHPFHNGAEHAPAGAATETESAPASLRRSLFEPGRNCFRAARAERVALLVDADEYFKAFAAAALRAVRSIVIVGWDFHSKTRLHHGLDGVPDTLGDFLNCLVKRRRTLHVHVLIWDYPVIFAKGRELSPIYGFGWRPRRRVHICYDDHYPIGAAQHQKLVVIDGVMAFCGGLDLTRSRWDTPEHKPGDERRTNLEETEPYPPFHDTMMAVDGEAAKAIVDVVRDRWRRATGHELLIPRQRVSPWPENLPVAVRDVNVAIARTIAPIGPHPAVTEVHALYLDMIAAAKRFIYIENQYFTSESLGEALAARLAEPDGPEVIAVLRLSTEGWLEAPTMGVLRTVLLQKLRQADRHGRFHAYYPHIPGLPEGQCCDLHSKLIIVDDEWLRIGSANFCNRSMGLDTECDLTLEACGDERIAQAIRAFRHRLLAEHLDVAPEAVAEKEREIPSLHALIAAFRTDDGRTLREYEQLDEPSEAMLAVASVADPETPVSLDRLIVEMAPETDTFVRRSIWARTAAVLLGLALLAGLWQFGPLTVIADANRIADWAEQFGDRPWAAWLVVALYTPAAFLMFPRPLITLFAVVALGAWLGFACAFAGIMISALLTFALGRRLNRQSVRRIAGSRLTRLTQLFRRRGLLTMTAVRLVPLAPFIIVNIVAGAIRIRPRDFLVGSAIGILPGTLVATVFGEQLSAALRDPSSVNLWFVVLVLVLATLISWWTRRWLFVSRPPGDGAGSLQRT